jgi:hypothetical protein
MKNKIFFIFLALLITTPAFALRWGVFERYTRNYEDFALSYALDGDPVYYYIIIDNEDKKTRRSQDEAYLIRQELKNELINEDKANSFALDIDKSFKLWFKETATVIRKAGRTEEFADIMDILNNSIQTQRVYKREEADIVIHYTSNKKMHEKCGTNATGCITLYEVPRVIVIITPEHYNPFKPTQRKSDTNAVLFHEIGHFYGLVDQYKDFGDSSLIYSTADRFKDYNSVMGDSHSNTLGCDDVDGFINLIDITLSLENGGEFSQRAKEGWASFCNGKQQPYTNGQKYKNTFYKEGKILDKGTYKRGDCIYNYDKGGNVTYVYCHLDDNRIVVEYKNKKFQYEKNSMEEKIFTPYSLDKSITLNKNKECKIINYSPVSVEGYDGFTLTLKNGRLQKDFGNTFVFKGDRVNVIKDNDNSCRFKIWSHELFTLNGNNITDENELGIKVYTKRYSLTKDDLINVAKNKCYDDIPQKVIDGLADICDFMENLEIPEE